MSIQYIYLGYGVTDENGECKLDHDANGDSISHSYTGTGAGKIDVVASLDSPSSISDSSLVSETFVLWDTLFYDSGTTGTVNSKWKINGGNGNRTSSSDGTTFENVDSSIRFDNFIQNNSSDIYFWNAPFCVELDIVQIQGSARLQIFSRESSQFFNGCGAIGHWKITYDGTTLVATKDNGSPTSYERNLSNARIGFYVSQGESITFKNLKVYLI